MMDWTDLLTLAIASWGAVLATWTAVADRRHKRRQLKVRMSNGFPYYMGGIGDVILIVEAANSGARPVTVASLVITLPDKQQLILDPRISGLTLPHTLAEGQSCSAWIEARNAAITLARNGYSGRIRLRGVARDATGEIYRSKPFSFGIDEWLST